MEKKAMGLLKRRDSTTGQRERVFFLNQKTIHPFDLDQYFSEGEA